MEEFEQIFSEWSTLSIALRLIAALVVGIMIGIDRGAKRRGAGIKTYSLVCLGAALVMLTGQYIYMEFDAKNDIARLGAQVISGVGFLGVGTIMVTGRNQIKGLTTAAGLWTCACLGLAIGIGFVDGALVTTFLVFVTLKVLARVDIYLYHNSKVIELYIEFENNRKISLFFDEMRKQKVKVAGFELGKSKIKGEGPNAVITLEVNESKMHATLVDIIRTLDGIHYVEEM